MKSSIHSTRELARLLGLSRWTVSRALNGHRGISAETAARVHEAARLHGFAPNILGRGLRAGKTDLLGVCVPDLVDYFLTDKISRLQEVVAERGFHPVIQITNGTKESENAALERFAAMRCAGVVMIASRLETSDTGIRSLEAIRVPAVRIDPVHTDGGDVVATDRVYAMRQVILRLHDLGHRSVAGAGINPRRPYGVQRINGLKAGCRACGWVYSRDVPILNADESLEDFALGAALAEKFLRECKGKVSAVVALNDRIAFGMMQALIERGVEVPGEVSIVGYDNADFSVFTSPSLTTIDPQVNVLIDRAVEMLTGRIACPDGAAAPMVLVKPRLVERGSMGRARGRGVGNRKKVSGGRGR